MSSIKKLWFWRCALCSPHRQILGSTKILTMGTRIKSICDNLSRFWVAEDIALNNLPIEKRLPFKTALRSNLRHRFPLGRHLDNPGLRNVACGNSVWFWRLVVEQHWLRFPRETLSFFGFPLAFTDNNSMFSAFFTRSACSSRLISSRCN